MNLENICGDGNTARLKLIKLGLRFFLTWELFFATKGGKMNEEISEMPN